MGTFNRGGNDRFGGRGGKPSFGGRPSFGAKKWEGGGGFDKEMFKAVCAECSRPCEVPFRPMNGKPVFCKECFASQGGPSMDRMDRAPRKDFGVSRDFGNRAPARPQFDNANKGAGNGEVMKMIETLSTKIESLTKAVYALSGAKTPEVKAVVAQAPVQTPAPIAPVKKEAKKEVEIVSKAKPVAKKTQSKKKK